MKPLLHHICCAVFFLFALSGCADDIEKDGYPNYKKPRPAIYSVELAELNSKSLITVNTPNCVLDVEPGHLKKCAPEMGPLATGVSGQFQIDGIRPHRNWAPMVALEFSSLDDTHKLRLKFNITAYKIDSDGNAVLQETPFKGVAEMWANKELQWSLDLPIEALPAQAFNFVVVWNADQTLELRLAQTAWKTVPLGFEVRQVSLLASGTMVSTDHLAMLQK